MFLKKVKIKNYRQLKNNVELDMQDSLTVLAGPNNSGKTEISVVFPLLLGPANTVKESCISNSTLFFNCR